MNNTKKNKPINFLFTYLLITCLLISFNLSAQEKLVNLQNNQVLINFHKTNKTDNNKHAKRQTIELPFLDDFSADSPLPNPDLWTNCFAFCNRQFAVNPPTYGVATFDAIDDKGYVYEIGEGGNEFIADTLSSQPINLNYPTSSGVYFSFFYQPQGRGDAPEETDSLVLEFYAPELDEWFWKWSAAGSIIKDFTKVMIPVTEAKFLRNGFRFRFYNYVTLKTGHNSSLIGNSDQWHIDYVYLDKNRTADENMREIAITEPFSSFLDTYEAIPWNHVNGRIKLKNNMTIILKNSSNLPNNISALRFVIDDLWGNGSTSAQILGDNSLNSNEQKSFILNLNNVNLFNSNSVDSALFSIDADFQNDDNNNDLILANNRITYFQHFGNYYAYDDGTSENGYGITGEGTQSASVAYRFVSLKADTLRAVQMYFNKSLNLTNDNYFYLSVWSNKNGKPDKILLKQIGAHPGFEDFETDINKFRTYAIEATGEEAVFVSDTFYIGWTQTTPDFLNIGYDMNRKTAKSIYYNISGEWKESAFDGALMMRPVFGTRLQTETKPFTEGKNVLLKMYPNPPSQFINLEYIDNIDPTAHFITIRNNYGVIVFHSPLVSQIDIQNFKSGVYYLIVSDNKTYTNTRKILILPH